jgi:hypothetical protein
VDRIDRSEPKLATIRDLLGHRAHGLAHSLQPVESLFAAATGHYCGHGDHLSGASTVVVLRQQTGVLYGRWGLGGHDDDVLDHGALLSTEPRMGIGPTAGSSVLSGRDNAFGGQVLERQWWRLERESPRRSRPPTLTKPPFLDQQYASSRRNEQMPPISSKPRPGSLTRQDLLKGAVTPVDFFADYSDRLLVFRWVSERSDSPQSASYLVIPSQNEIAFAKLRTTSLCLVCGSSFVVTSVSDP